MRMLILILDPVPVLHPKTQFCFRIYKRHTQYINIHDPRLVTRKVVQLNNNENAHVTSLHRILAIERQLQSRLSVPNNNTQEILKINSQ